MTSYKTITGLLAIWDELPALAGEEHWAGLEAGLHDYLMAFEAARDDETRARISRKIQLLLAERAPRGLDRLDEVMETLEQAERMDDMQGGVHKGGDAVRGGNVTRGGHDDRGRLRVERVMGDLTSFLDRQTAAVYVTRYTDIVCPRRVWVETPRISVVMRLTVAPPAHSAAVEALPVVTGRPVRVRVQAPGFDVLNAPEQEIRILPEDDSPPLVFDLRPRTVGPTRITFDFFQSGNPAGTVSVPVEVVAGEVPDEAVVPPSQPIRGGGPVQAPDLMLYVAYERFQGQPSLTFTLFRAGEVGRAFHPVRLEDDPRHYAEELFRQLTGLTGHYEPTTELVQEYRQAVPPEDIDRRLRHLGQDLWRALIPSELKAIYAEERDAWRDRSLLIVSDEPYIPWELTWPYDEAGQRDDLLAELGGVRWTGTGHRASVF